MESSALLHCRMYAQGLTVGRKQFCSPIKRKPVLVSCIKSPEAAVVNKADGAKTEGSLEKKNNRRTATFPSGLEDLVLEVCDETEVAELKMKVGDFEMHLKRDIEAANTSVPKTYVETQLPNPAKSVEVSSPAAPPAKSLEVSSPAAPPAKSGQIIPFTNAPKLGKASKLAALESSATDGYVLVTSPHVGIFNRGRKVKRFRLPPRVNEGVRIKEGQAIGYVDLLGADQPVKSDVAGQVIKLLVDDGEAVGYGDPIAAVLPSFGIN